MLPAAMLASGAAAIFGSGLSALKDKLFQKTDTDNNSSVSQSEFLSLAKAGQKVPGAATSSATSVNSTDAAKAQFAKIDTNTDGALSKGELDSYQQQLVSQMQSAMTQLQQLYSGNQSAPAQPHGHHRHHPSLSEQFSKIDADSSGALSKDEVTSFLSARKPDAPDASKKSADLFAALDTNRDGSVNKDEVAAFDAARKARHAQASNTAQPPGTTDLMTQMNALLEALQKQTGANTRSASVVVQANSAYAA